MARLFDLVRMTTATTGAGNITLGSAVAPYRTFAAAGVTDGMKVHYSIFDPPNSETGIGTYTVSGTVLSRDTILASTNANAAINLSGNALVGIDFNTGMVPKIGTVTLTASATSTTITDAAIFTTSAILLIAASNHAANDESTAYIDDSTGYTNGSATITHASNARSDRKFRYVIHNY